MVLLAWSVVEGAYLFIVTTRSVAILPLVVVGMVQLLHRGVALVAQDAIRTQLPRIIAVRRLGHGLAVLGAILEDLWRPSKIAHVVRVYAAL